MPTYHVYAELEDALEGDTINSHVVVAFDAADAVSDACQLFWSDNDGWEWMRDGCTLYSVSRDGTILRHDIGPPDFIPEFYVPDGEAVGATP